MPPLRGWIWAAVGFGALEVDGSTVLPNFARLDSRGTAVSTLRRMSIRAKVQRSFVGSRSRASDSAASGWHGFWRVESDHDSPRGL